MFSLVAATFDSSDNSDTDEEETATGTTVVTATTPPPAGGGATVAGDRVAVASVGTDPAPPAPPVDDVTMRADTRTDFIVVPPGQDTRRSVEQSTQTIQGLEATGEQVTTYFSISPQRRRLASRYFIWCVKCKHCYSR